MERRMAETTPTTKSCSTCHRETRGTSRGMCANCYRIWQRVNLPANATCEVCGCAYFRRPSASPKGRTCGRPCFVKWKQGRNQHNEPTDGATLLLRECEWCSAEFTVEKRQVDNGLGRFCSLQCNAARRAVPRLKVDCEWCGERFLLLPNRTFYGCGRFCSRHCYECARRAARLPREADRSDRTYRRFRDELLAGAKGCERCGTSLDLMLHHRIRTRERPDLLFTPSNLEVLCRSCHTRHHGDMGHMRIPETAA